MRHLPDGLVARIRRFHRRGPGSIPGQGSLCFKAGHVLHLQERGLQMKEP